MLHESLLEIDDVWGLHLEVPVVRGVRLQLQSDLRILEASTVVFEGGWRVRQRCPEGV